MKMTLQVQLSVFCFLRISAHETDFITCLVQPCHVYYAFVLASDSSSKVQVLHTDKRSALFWRTMMQRVPAAAHMDRNAKRQSSQEDRSLNKRANTGSRGSLVAWPQHGAEAAKGKKVGLSDCAMRLDSYQEQGISHTDALLLFVNRHEAE